MMCTESKAMTWMKADAKTAGLPVGHNSKQSPISQVHVLILLKLITNWIPNIIILLVCNSVSEKSHYNNRVFTDGPRGMVVWGKF